MTFFRMTLLSFVLFFSKNLNIQGNDTSYSFDDQDETVIAAGDEDPSWLAGDNDVDYSMIDDNGDSSSGQTSMDWYGMTSEDSSFGANDTDMDLESE